MAHDIHKTPSTETTISPCNRPVIPDIFFAGDPWTVDAGGFSTAGAPIFPFTGQLFSPLFGCFWSKLYPAGPGLNLVEVRVNDFVDGQVVLIAYYTRGGVQHTTVWSSFSAHWWNDTFTALSSLTVPQTITAFNP